MDLSEQIKDVTTYVLDNTKMRRVGKPEYKTADRKNILLVGLTAVDYKLSSDIPGSDAFMTTLSICGIESISYTTSLISRLLADYMDMCGLTVVEAKRRLIDLVDTDFAYCNKNTYG